MDGEGAAWVTGRDLLRAGLRGLVGAALLALAGAALERSYLAMSGARAFAALHFLGLRAGFLPCLGLFLGLLGGALGLLERPRQPAPRRLGLVVATALAAWVGIWVAAVQACYLQALLLARASGTEALRLAALAALEQLRDLGLLVRSFPRDAADLSLALVAPYAALAGARLWPRPGPGGPGVLVLGVGVGLLAYLPLLPPAQRHPWGAGLGPVVGPLGSALGWALSLLALSGALLLAARLADRVLPGEGARG